jgi:hypothetical protein
MKVICKIIYPNGKIFVGKDLTDTITFGNAHSRLIAADFTPEKRRDFTVRRQILWGSDTAADTQVAAKEIAFIIALRSNHPAIGYNRWPRPRGTPVEASLVR